MPQAVLAEGGRLPDDPELVLGVEGLPQAPATGMVADAEAALARLKVQGKSGTIAYSPLVGDDTHYGTWKIVA